MSPSQTKQEFLETFQTIVRLNQECLDLSSRFDSLVEKLDSSQVSFSCISGVAFGRFARRDDQDWYSLKKVGNTRTLKVASLRHCFSGFQNHLKTTLPDFFYQDLTEELQIYQWLKASKGLQALKGLKEGLEAVKTRLEERILEVESLQQISSKALQILELVDIDELTYKSKEGPYVSLRIDMKIDLVHERALLDVEELKSLIQRHFDVSETPKTEDLICGIDEENRILFHKKGEWVFMDGSLKQVTVGPTGYILGVNNQGEIWFRKGVSECPEGKEWVRIDGGLKYISCGAIKSLNKDEDMPIACISP